LWRLVSTQEHKGEFIINNFIRLAAELRLVRSLEVNFEKAEQLLEKMGEVAIGERQEVATTL